MSDNSGKSSGGIVKTFKRAFKLDVSGEYKGRQPVAKNSGIVNNSRMNPSENVAARGIRQLDRNGFVIYNLKEQSEIFVSRPSEQSAFDEDVPIIKMSTEKFEDTVESPEQETVMDTSEPVAPEEMFVNIIPKPKYEEIDFSEVIIKQHDPESVPACSSDLSNEAPIYTDEGQGLVELDSGEESLEMPASLPVVIGDLAATSTGAIDMNATCGVGYVNEPPVLSEIVEDSTDEIQEEPALDIVGGRTEGDANINITAPADVTSGNMLLETVKLELAETSEVDPKITVAALPVLDIADAPCMINEIKDETPLEVVIEVKDVVADILKLTLPELNDDEMTMADLPADVEKRIPDDGLESYDFKFQIREPVNVPVTGSMTVDFERRKLQTIGSSLNFTF